MSAQKHGGGRPPKVIDFEDFETLCSWQCTKNEICEYLEVSDKTLDRLCRENYQMSFSEVFAQKRGSGKISLRRAQYQKAMDGNVTMLIWLGKQWLGQRDKAELSCAAAPGGKPQPLVVRFVNAVNGEPALPEPQKRLE